MNTKPQTATETLNEIATIFHFTPTQREVLGLNRNARRPAPCRNAQGSALRPEGACTQAAIRVKGDRSYNLCTKCAAHDAAWLAPQIDSGDITVTVIA